jgi:hypothetical protein
MSDDIIKAFPGHTLPENPLAIAPRHPEYCSHEAVLLDQHNRTVICANLKCGATLDPFSFLLSNARTIESAWSSYRQVQNQVKEVTERVHALKKEEQRLRAMLKRLQDKSGAVLTVRGKPTL